jgi:hypothetical protein
VLPEPELEPLPEPVLLEPVLLEFEPMLPEPVVSELVLLELLCFLCFLVVVFPDWSELVLLPDCPIEPLEVPDWPIELSELLPDWPMELPELPDCVLELPELPDCAKADMPAVNATAKARVKSFFIMKSSFLYLICEHEVDVTQLERCGRESVACSRGNITPIRASLDREVSRAPRLIIEPPE